MRINLLCLEYWIAVLIAPLVGDTDRNRELRFSFVPFAHHVLYPE